jgi:hypothetical protein
MENNKSQYRVNYDLQIDDKNIKNSIVFCSSLKNLNDDKLFILYNKEKNNIYVFDMYSFNRYLLYNDIDTGKFYENYILISLIDNTSYGKEREPDQIIKIKIIIINLLRLNSKLYNFSLKDEQFIKDHKDDIDTFNKSFEYYFSNFNNGYNNQYKKKYKLKYMKLKKYLDSLTF